MYSFNLVDDKWIPCIILDGTLYEKGIKEVILGADSIKEIFDNSPLVTIALHRLLLAILHRSFDRGYGPINAGEWNTLWNNGKFGYELITKYLETFRNRFDLFDNRYPFYQCASLTSSDIAKIKFEPISVGNVIHESAIYLSKATLFDHSTETSFKSLSLPEASRFLLAFQSFVVGGYAGLSKPRLRGEESAKAAPLVKKAVCLAQGKNLFETLMLNLLVYNPKDDEPFYAEEDDKPAWENNGEIRPQERQLKGYFDLLTWQSRRVKFLPERDETGRTIIRNILVRKGNQVIDDLHGKETMVAFHTVIKPKEEQVPWPPVILKEDKALWRDNLSLFQSLKGENARPKILDWLNNLVENGFLPANAIYNMAVFGLISDQASISLWRHERLPLPLPYLQDENLVSKLKDALELAEDVGKLLGPGFIKIDITDKKGKRKTIGVPSPLRNLARLILVPEVEIQKLNENQKKEIDNLINSLSPARPYWAALGIAFNRFMIDLVADKGPDGKTYGEKTLPEWAKEIHKAAHDAFNEITRSLDRTGRMLKAVSKAENEFKNRLYNILKPYIND